MWRNTERTIIDRVLLQVHAAIIRVGVAQDMFVPFPFPVMVAVSVWAETAVAVAVTGLMEGEGHAFESGNKSTFKIKELITRETTYNTESVV